MFQNKFLFENTTNSTESSEIIINSLWPYFKGLNSFLDLGCGMGAWSAEFEKRGIDFFFCYDHPSLPKQNLLIKNKENFYPIDLEKSLPPKNKVDFAICIEVLEHFKNNRSLELLNFLTNSSDLILFSAAVPFQKGQGHINEKNHSFWHDQFQMRGYQFFDGFKRGELMKKSDRNNFFHFQNTFLYFRPEKYTFPRELNITSDNFELRYTYLLDKDFTISDSLSILKKAIVNSLIHRLKLK
jgi:SAM-dependent methyltransferase